MCFLCKSRVHPAMYRVSGMINYGKNILLSYKTNQAQKDHLFLFGPAL